MKISIFTEKKQWICRRAAEELCKYLPECTIGGDYEKADIVYLMPYTKIGEVGKIKGKLVTLFTHMEARNAKKMAAWDSAAKRADAHVFMSKQWRDIFKGRNYPGVPQTVIHWASDLHCYSRDVVFGVVGKARPRKRPEFVGRLVDDGFSVQVFGQGWPIKSYSGIEIPLGRANFYRNIDYLIVTSEIEGGPVPVLDALAMKVPVIAPDVGWCWEYPVIKYDGTYEDLSNICWTLSKQKESRTWERFAVEHKVFFDTLTRA